MYFVYITCSRRNILSYIYAALSKKCEVGNMVYICLNIDSIQEFWRSKKKVKK